MLSATRTLLRSSLIPSTRLINPVQQPSSQILLSRSLNSRSYSTTPTAEEPTQEPAAATEAPSTESTKADQAATSELQAKLDQQSKTIAELKVTD